MRQAIQNQEQKQIEKQNKKQIQAKTKNKSQPRYKILFNTKGLFLNFPQPLIDILANLCKKCKVLHINLTAKFKSFLCNLGENGPSLFLSPLRIIHRLQRLIFESIG